jgi:hypothetical protein
VAVTMRRMRRMAAVRRAMGMRVLRGRRAGRTGVISALIARAIVIVATTAASAATVTAATTTTAAATAAAQDRRTPQTHGGQSAITTNHDSSADTAAGVANPQYAIRTECSAGLSVSLPYRYPSSSPRLKSRSSRSS